MYKYFIIISLAFFYLSCQNQSEPQTETPEEMESEGGALYLESVLKSNSAVKVGTLQNKVISQSIKCTGSVQIPHFEIVAVHSKSKGFVESMRYIPGDYIKKGTLLFKITNPELLEKQRLFLETKAEFSLAEKELERKTKLRSGEATSQKAFDEALSRKELLTATFKGLKSELKMIGVDVERLENEQSFQSELPVYAPKSGYIHEVFVHNGQMVTPDDRLMEMANNQHIHVALQVLSKDVPHLKVGQKVSFTLPNNPESFSATVEKLNPMIDPETGTLNVHCHIEKRMEKQVKIGMFINAEIFVDEKTVIGLPTDAVIKEGSAYYAYIVEGETLKKQLLNNVEVNNGFVSFSELPADRLVVSGAYYVE